MKDWAIEQISTDSIDSSIKEFHVLIEDGTTESFYYLDGTSASIRKAIIEIVQRELATIDNSTSMQFFKYDPALPQHVAYGEETYPGSDIYTPYLILSIGGDPAKRLQCAFYEDGELIEAKVLSRDPSGILKIREALDPLRITD